MQLLLNISGPKIPGLFDFKGSLLHTANWDPSKFRMPSISTLAERYTRR